MYRDRNAAFTLIELLVVIAVIAIIAALLFPVFAAVRGKGWQTVCLSNLSQLGKAVQMYMQDYDETFPFVLNWSANWTPAGGANIGDVGNQPRVRGATGQERQFQLVTVVAPYVKNENVWYCPSASRDWVWEKVAKGGAWTKGATMRDQGTTYCYNYTAVGFHDINWTHRTFMGNKHLAILREAARWPMLWDEPDNVADPPSDGVPPHSGSVNVAYGDGHAKFYHVTINPLWGYWYEHSSDGLLPGQ
jgi:prepilin-type N-terminal cleavage/methylation domain-containing protein/prepilin-type processing-associated H-X9-DG protein